MSYGTISLAVGKNKNFRGHVVLISITKFIDKVYIRRIANKYVEERYENKFNICDHVKVCFSLPNKAIIKFKRLLWVYWYPRKYQ